MTKNPKDFSREPPGGRALERLRQFEDARRPSDATPKNDQKKNDGAKPRDPNDGEKHDERPD